jgi:hypothetical protein
MKKSIYVVLACLIVFVSCSKTNEPVVSAIRNEVRVKVYNTMTWNPATNKMDTVVGAAVRLISDSIVSYTKTDNTGVATFSGVSAKSYHINASNGDLSNLISTTIVDYISMGYLIIGVYTSQEDINTSAYNLNAVVGGPKIEDLNHDGFISKDDYVTGIYLKYDYLYKDVNGDGVIDVKDLVNGNIIRMDNVVQINAFVVK